jgi:hypothetical protein
MGRLASAFPVLLAPSLLGLPLAAVSHERRAAPLQVVAVGVLRPACEGCKVPKGFSPVDPRSRSILLAPLRRPYRDGTWCFRVAGHRRVSGAILVVNVTEEGPASEGPASSAPRAKWVPSAPDCLPDEFEIRTFDYKIVNGQFTKRPDKSIPFVFAVID